MPSKSPAQHRLMEAAAHDPKIAKETGISKKVATEFVKADAKKDSSLDGHRKLHPSR